MPKDNRSAMRKTIVARIATFDTSIPNPTEELSEADLQYFKDNPQAAGHFDMKGGE